MRIHSDTLSPEDIYAAARTAGCTVESLSQHGSTARGRAFDLILAGHGKRGGQYGGLDHRAGSWDDYGIFLAALYRSDAFMLVGSPGRPVYEGRSDFDDATAYRYQHLTPDQAHHAHKRDHSADAYITMSGRRLLPCKGSQSKPCSALI